MNEFDFEQTPRPRRFRKFIKRALGLTLLVGILAAATMFYLARSQPAHWKEHQAFLSQTPPAEIERIAEDVRVKIDTLANLGIVKTTASQTPKLSINDAPANALKDNLAVDPTQKKVKPEDVHINQEQMLTLDNPQLAAVVETGLEEWMQDRGYVKPPEINDPMVAVDGEKLVMAFQFKAGGFKQVISGKFDVKIREDGIAELTMSQFLVGKLPVPVNAISQYLSKQTSNNDRAAQVGQWLEKLQYFEFKPVLEIENRRRLRVMDYKLMEKGLELTVRVQDHKTYKAMNKALASVPVD